MASLHCILPHAPDSLQLHPSYALQRLATTIQDCLEQISQDDPPLFERMQPYMENGILEDVDFSADVKMELGGELLDKEWVQFR